MINFIYSLPIESLFFVGIIAAVVALLREEIKQEWVEYHKWMAENGYDMDAVNL